MQVVITVLIVLGATLFVCSLAVTAWVLRSLIRFALRERTYRPSYAEKQAEHIIRSLS